MGKGKVLDIGCSDGELLRMLPSSFHKVGVDISEINRESAKKGGIKCLYKSLEEVSISEKFDLIMALDFIEHVVNPKETLHVISKLLSPGGYVVIETGNANSFVAKFLKEDWPYTAVYGHMRILTPLILSKFAHEMNINKISLKKGWHAKPSVIFVTYRNILSLGFHAFRGIYRSLEPASTKIKYLRKLYEHWPPSAPQPDHMIFVGQKE